MRAFVLSFSSYYSKRQFIFFSKFHHTNSRWNITASTKTLLNHRLNFITYGNVETVFHSFSICSSECQIFAPFESHPNPDDSQPDGQLSDTLACPATSMVNNSSLPGWNGRHSAHDIFKCIFVNEKVSILVKISLKFVSLTGQLTLNSIGLDNGLTPKNWQAIIRNNVDQIDWRIYAALGR